LRIWERYRGKGNVGKKKDERMRRKRKNGELEEDK
jgi:hypothetical protein